MSDRKELKKGDMERKLALNVS